MKTAVLVMLGGLVALIASWVLGSVVASWFAPGWLGLIAGAAAAVIVGLGLPVWFDWRVLVGTRKDDPNATTTVHQSLAIWGAAVLALLVFALPSTTRRGLETRGDWVLLSPVDESPSGLLRAVRGFTPHIPRSEPALASASDAEAGPLGDGSASAAAESATAASAQPAPIEPTASADTAQAAIDEMAQAGIASASSAAAQGEIPATQAVSGPAEVFRKFADSVVIIKARTKLADDSPYAQLYQHIGIDSAEGFGSGFIVDPSGVIVTNQHVIGDSEQLLVQLRDGREFPQVQRLAESRTHDLAILKVEAKDLRVIDVDESTESVDIGDTAIAIGSPLGLEYSLTTGIVSALRTRDSTSMLQMQTTIAPGSSGGPLLSNDGKLIGVNVATAGAGLNYAITAKHVKELLQQPQKVHTYEAYEPGVIAGDLSSEGLELGPTDRSTLAEGFKLWGTFLKRCMKKLPEGADLIYSFPKSSGVFADPTITGSAAPDLDDCEASFAELISRQLRLLLLQNHASAAERGCSVSVVLSGMGSEGSAKLKLTLRIAGADQPASTP